MLVSPKKLDFWIEHRYNVLFNGERGVGKTSIVIEAFRRAGLRYIMLSGATMDPFIDFVGVPVQVTGPDGTKVIDLLRPKYIVESNPQAIFVDEFNRCLVGSTPIPLADGTTKTIAELAGLDEFFVYSCDPATKKVHIGRGHSARKTIINSPVVKVTLDNGEFVRVSPDHPFLMRSGVYREAQSLQPGESLMPLYRQLSEKLKEVPAGYEQVWQPETSEWDYTHHLADLFNLKAGVYLSTRGRVRHHKDFNKLNNSPTNIQRVGWYEHQKLHRETGANGGRASHQQHPDLASRTILTEQSKTLATQRSTATRSTSESYRALRSAITNQFFTPVNRKKQGQTCSTGWASGQFENIDRQQARNVGTITRAVFLAAGLKSLTPKSYQKAADIAKTAKCGKGKGWPKLSAVLSAIGDFDIFAQAVEDFKLFGDIRSTVDMFTIAMPETATVAANNHFVVSVEPDGFEDVWDLTVDDYHNFAVGQGVFVHNTHKKVRNAMMELIQFKSINGNPMGDDLRIVWAAINPDSDQEGNGEYDTDRLDPAQRDRFHIMCDIPYKCDKEYFAKKYDPEVAKAAIQYWDELPEPIRKQVSPRRLDYALQIWQDGGDLRDVLPTQANVNRLTQALQIGPAETRLNALVQDPKAAKAFFKDENNYTSTINTVLRLTKYRDILLPHIPVEKLATLFSANVEARGYMGANLKEKGTASPYYAPLNEVVKANQNTAVAKIISKYITESGAAAAGATPATAGSVRLPVFAAPSTPIADSNLTQVSMSDFTTTAGRKLAYNSLKNAMGTVQTETQARMILKLADNLCVSRAQTVADDMPEMNTIANTALLFLRNNGMNNPAKAKEVLDAYPNLFKYRAKVGAERVGDMVKANSVVAI
jgi:MoxR-like ATPase